MKITPNYQLKAFNLSVNNEKLHTNPSFAGMKKQIAEKVLPATVGVITAGTVLAMQNGKTKEAEPAEAKQKADVKQDIPTREEFEKMMDKDKCSRYAKSEWLEAYDTDAKTTMAFYNLKDKEGIRYADENYLTMYRIENYHKHPELVKQVVDTEDENGVRIFSFRMAEAIVNRVADSPNGLTKMLSLKDDYGNLRFQNPDDYIAAEVFEKYPEEAEKYAMAKDEMGNYRFNGKDINMITNAKMLEKPIEKDPNKSDGAYHHRLDTINDIVEAKSDGYIKTEDIDNILSLKRNDGSFVFNELPDFRTIRCSAEEPELFSKISNVKTPNRYKYVESDYIASLIKDFRFYPEEATRLLQIPTENPFDSRFSELDIIPTRLDASKLLKSAPKAFMLLTNMKRGEYNNDGYRFSLKDICKIMLNVGSMDEKGNIKEFSKEDMKAIYNLSKIEVINRRNNYRGLDTDDICKLFNIYKKYPKETQKIVTEYANLDKYNDFELIIPDETDIEMFKSNPESFENTYVKRYQ